VERIRESQGHSIGPCKDSRGQCSLLSVDSAEVPDVSARGRRVNHITFKQASAREHLVGQVVACLLLAFMAVGAGMLYLLNYPDAQVRNYAVKLVSVVFSIFTAVLLEKIQLSFIKREIVMVAIHEHVAPKGSSIAVWIEFGIALALTLMWFTAISLLAFVYRRSKTNLFAVKALVAHETAFVGIHCFGYFEKYVIVNWVLDKTPDWIDVSIYIAFPVLCYGGFRCFQECTEVFRMTLKRRFDDPPADPAHSPQEETEQSPQEEIEQKGSHEPTQGTSSSSLGLAHNDHGHEDRFVHLSREAENDAIALIASFLIRQGILFWVTGRVPSLKGDVAQNPTSELCAILGIVVFFTVIIVLVQRLRNIRGRSLGQGDLGLLLEKLHFWQFLSCMTIGWCILSLCQWCLQRCLAHMACWSVGSAVMVTPMAVLVLISVDALGDKQMVDKDLESCAVNGCGLLIGFAWEVAFAGAIDTLSSDTKMQLTSNIGLCSILIAIIFPAWRFYVLPLAALPPPRRSVLEVPKLPGSSSTPDG